MIQLLWFLSSLINSSYVNHNQQKQEYKKIRIPCFILAFWIIWINDFINETLTIYVKIDQNPEPPSQFSPIFPTVNHYLFRGTWYKVLNIYPSCLPSYMLIKLPVWLCKVMSTLNLYQVCFTTSELGKN